MALTKVSGNLIEDNAVGLSQLAGGTDGNLITFDASGNPSHVPTGTATHVLTSNGAGAAPTFQATLQPAGSILEELSLVCNGETQTVSSGTYTAPNVTALQNVTGTFADINGSSITYTPPAGTTRVVYTCSVQVSYVNADSFGDITFFLDSDEVVHARTGISGYYTDEQHHFTWTYRIGGSADTNTGRVASWSSGKTMKVQVRYKNSGHEFRLHRTSTWADAGAEHLSVPRLSVRAIK